MAYDTATNVIAAACAECGITAVADPFSSTDDTQIQMRLLLNQCGRELYAMHQWQQFISQASIATTASPVATGLYDLPADFGYMINQTGWSPASGGTGFPMGGPLTRQQATYLVAVGATSTVTLFFDLHTNKIAFIPPPAPASITITYDYMSNSWALSAASVLLTACTASDDVVKYEPILIATMLAMRFRQAKGVDAAKLEQRFQLLFAQFTGVNAPAPILRLARTMEYPYLNAWDNVRNTGYGA